MRIVLASASPRRKQYLSYLGLPFEVVVPDVDESTVDGETPEQLVMRLSKLKAKAVSQRLSDNEAVIIAADTVVAYKGQVLGKPKNDDDAFNMIKMLQGDTHEVYTGCTILKGDRISNFAVSTKVTFASLDDELIRTYVNSGESRDKAGSYALQGIAAMLIQKVDGSVSTVVGLPICEVREVLKEFGVKPETALGV
ncbi:MAG: septum formation inhibitor Maf [Succinivibrio sp.]|nr:septum formation inhibitor Maf [Succinivibrio sp.]